MKLGKDESEIQELFRKGVKPFNAASPWKEGDPVGTLDKAIKYGASADVIRQLLKEGALPSAFEDTHESHALDNLLQNSKYPDDLVASLLQAKATPTKPRLSDDGEICTLRHAVQHRSIEVVRLLVEAKAHATLDIYGPAPKEKQTEELFELIKTADENRQAAYRPLASEPVARPIGPPAELVEEPPVQQPVIQQQPVEQAQPERQDQDRRLQEERLAAARPRGIPGCLQRIFGGIWAFIGGIIDYLLSFVSDDRGERVE